jgi:hypothetical protein
MARDVMILLGENPFEGHHWKGWALKIETFLGPEMATSEASAIWAQKSRVEACVSIQLRIGCPMPKLVSDVQYPVLWWMSRAIETV